MTTIVFTQSWMTEKWGYVVFVNGTPVAWVACQYATREEAAQAAYVETGVTA